MFESTPAAPIQTEAPSVARALELMRAADALNAAAALMVSTLTASSAFERATGLPTELAISLGARRPRWDARELVRLADALGDMPRTAEGLGRGIISFAQARAIAREAAPLPVRARAVLDEVLAAHAERLAQAEPEQLVWLAESEAARHHPGIGQSEDRRIRGRFLALQQRLGGGGCIYGEADTEGFAAIAQAVEDAAGAPDPGVRRARQRMDALIAICEARASGGSGRRARPRVVLTADLAELERLGAGVAARVLAAVAGRPMAVSSLSARVLACDADLELVAFDGAQPVAGANLAPIPERIRRAVAARDGGCRFPGCSAPVAWCDCHHARPRCEGGSNKPANLVMLCRRCHRRAHRRGWTITFRADGAIEFRRGAQRHRSYPRALPLRE